MKTTYKSTLFYMMTALSTAACSGENNEPLQEAELEQRILAELDVRGARVQFTEMLPGAVVVAAQSRTRAENPLADPAIKGMDIVRMYEYWAGKPAPQILVDAPLRAAADGANQPDPTGKQAGDEWADDVARGIAPVAHSPEAFESEFCGSSDNLECTLDVIDRDKVFQWTLNWVSGMLNSVEGRLQLRLRENRPVRGWRTFGLWQVDSGVHFEFWGAPGGVFARNVQVRVENADDPYEPIGEQDFDNYHIAINGGL